MTGFAAGFIQASVQVCRKLIDKGLNIRVYINFSAKNAHPEMIKYLAGKLSQYNVPVQNTGIKITEFLRLHECNDPQQALNMLCKIGIALALENYGTVFSSLSYINKLNLNEIKINRSFVTDMDSNQDNSAMSHSTIHLGKILILKVIAKGIETGKY